MKCPYCHADDSKVIDSRSCQDGAVTRRRRECVTCKQRFTTFEYAVAPLTVIKKDGARDTYDRAKIRSGVATACNKRPVSSAAIERLVDSVEHELLNRGQPEVTSAAIGELILEHLRQLDHVAYLRFLSVYREFRNANDFASELAPLLVAADADADHAVAGVPG